MPRPIRNQPIYDNETGQGHYLRQCTDCGRLLDGPFKGRKPAGKRPIEAIDPRTGRFWFYDRTVPDSVYSDVEHISHTFACDYPDCPGKEQQRIKNEERAEYRKQHPEKYS